MDEDTVIEIIRVHMEGQFPKKCLCCGTVFTSLAEYIQHTFPIGNPVSYDLEKDTWDPPVNPRGALIFSHCKCRSTISVSSKGLDKSIFLALLEWFRDESTKRGLTVNELLEHLRSEIHRRVLAESNAGGP